jgi:hypothetical protein
MDKEIEKDISGIWSSIAEETSTLKNSQNLVNRIMFLSESKELNIAFQEWEEVTKLSSYSRDKNIVRNHKCLCGQVIDNVYIFKNTKTGEKAKIGSICCTKINKLAMEKYEDSNKIFCYVCCKKYKQSYIDAHILTEKHARNSLIDDEKKDKFKLFVKTNLNFFLNRYIKKCRKCLNTECKKLIHPNEPIWRILIIILFSSNC